MPLYHFSENPAIEIFVPRPPLAHPSAEARVWAVDAWHSPLYLVPSECPRVTCWPVSTTTSEDLKLYWPDGNVRMTIAIEHAWFEQFLDCKLYRYTMPEGSFVSCSDHWAYVCEKTVIPERVEEVGSLWRAMGESSVDFRVLPSLRDFGHLLMNTSFHWSFIRMRNSLDWDLPPGEPLLPKEPLNITSM